MDSGRRISGDSKFGSETGCLAAMRHERRPNSPSPATPSDRDELLEQPYPVPVPLLFEANDFEIYRQALDFGDCATPVINISARFQ